MISEEVFMDIIAMQHSGLSVRHIALKLGRHRNTVKKHIENKEFPHYHKHKRGVGILEPYKQIINGFLDQDDYQATWIFDRIKRIGYPGGYDTVKHYGVWVWGRTKPFRILDYGVGIMDYLNPLIHQSLIHFSGLKVLFLPMKT